jgi:hypothetical protein
VVFLWVPPELRPLDLATVTEDDRLRLHELAPLIKAKMQAAGTAMLGFQPVHGLNTFRILFMNPEVSAADVDAVFALIDQYGREVTAEPPNR